MEILVVLATVILIFLVVSPQFNKMKELQSVKNATGDIISVLNKAKFSTLASLNSSSYGVHFQSDQIVLFTGTTYSGGASGNEVIYISSPATISNVTLAGSSSSSGDVYFNRLSGIPDKSGTVTVTSPNFSKIVTISGTGVFSSN